MIRPFSKTLAKYLLTDFASLSKTIQVHSVGFLKTFSYTILARNNNGENYSHMKISFTRPGFRFSLWIFGLAFQASALPDINFTTHIAQQNKLWIPQNRTQILSSLYTKNLINPLPYYIVNVSKTHDTITFTYITTLFSQRDSYSDKNLCLRLFNIRITYPHLEFPQICYVNNKQIRLRTQEISV